MKFCSVFSTVYTRRWTYSTLDQATLVQKNGKKKKWGGITTNRMILFEKKGTGRSDKPHFCQERQTKTFWLYLRALWILRFCRLLFFSVSNRKRTLGVSLPVLFPFPLFPLLWPKRSNPIFHQSGGISTTTAHHLFSSKREYFKTIFLL